MEKINKKIIIVGNGSSVLKYKIGKKIDEFEEVVRFNNYCIDDYDKFIGKKTTIWSRSNSKYIVDRNQFLFKFVLICSPEWNFEAAKNLYKEKYKENGILYSKEDALLLQQELDLPGRLEKERPSSLTRGWPSTGLMTIDYLLRQYSVIYIYGFDFFKEDKGKPRHYYNNKEIMIDTYVHNGEKEKNWIKKKTKEGKIINILEKI